jgi:hypothetical protein
LNERNGVVKEDVSHVPLEEKRGGLHVKDPENAKD